MSTAEDIRDDARINENHDDHVERGENHWFTCPLCDDEEDDSVDDHLRPSTIEFAPTGPTRHE